MRIDVFKTNPPEQLLYRNMQRFRGGLVFKAHRLLNHSTLGFRVIRTKKEERTEVVLVHMSLLYPTAPHRLTSLIRKSDPLEPYSRTMYRALWWP